jgi:putative ABC transport system permease protein
LFEEVIGDLEEKFSEMAKNKGARLAQLNYWYQVFHYVRPFAIRKSKSIHINQYDMFQNYFKIATRNLLKQKLYSIINIGGLALGLTCFLMILLYVQHEFSYNTFYPNADRIYRVYQKQSGNMYLGTDYFAVTPAQLASVMREELPEVVSATSIQEPSGLLSIGDKHFFEKGLAGDDHFFQVLPVPFVKGNPRTALADPKSIVLTKSLAQTMFGDEDPVGQIISFQNEPGYQVTSVINDPPSNSSLKYSFIVSILYNKGYGEDKKRIGWSNNSYFTFFVLAGGVDPSILDKKFASLLKKYQLPEDYKNYPFKDQYFAQPFADMYFQPNINFDLGLKGNKQAIYLFSMVAAIVLLLACVNYMNLAIARSIKRSREVGLRKVVGAVKRQLIGQFLGESVLIAFFSLVFALGLTYLLLPYFSQMMERPIELNFFANPYLFPALLVLVLIVGIFSGSYPAFLISSLKPIEVLKAKVNFKISGFGLQRSLIVIQFAASITLVIASIIIYQQLHFIHQKELGYDKRDVITIPLKDRSLLSKFQSLSQEWLQNPHVINATMSAGLPTNITSSNMISKDQGNPDKRDLAIYQWGVEHNFIDVFGVKLVAGRNFSPDRPTDVKESYLLNETAARALGWTPEEAIGKQIYHGEPKTIIGVVKDFHMHSMHLAIQPLMIFLTPGRGSHFSIKVAPDAVPATLNFLSKTIRANSNYPFEYQFLEENYDQLYQSEMKLGEIFGFFTVVSILIAALGLFGLAAFLSGQRTREIGIRKVLGASVNSIVVLLSQDFLKLVLLAFVVSIPIGWYIMHQWLQDFAYRIKIEWWMFALAGALAFFIANLSVAYQSLKASLMDPVDSLRSE